jgi:hypothetical protein
MGSADAYRQSIKCIQGGKYASDSLIQHNNLHRLPKALSSRGAASAADVLNSADNLRRCCRAKIDFFLSIEFSFAPERTPTRF